MEYEHYPLQTFRVSLTDRKNRRTVQAASGKEAVRLVVGKRFFSANQRSWTEDGASMDFMTKEELAERHELMLALPTMAEEREAARQRIQERIRNRRKRSEAGV